MVLDDNLSRAVCVDDVKSLDRSFEPPRPGWMVGVFSSILYR